MIVVVVSLWSLFKEHVDVAVDSTITLCNRRTTIIKLSCKKNITKAQHDDLNALKLKARLCNSLARAVRDHHAEIIVKELTS